MNEAVRIKLQSKLAEFQAWSADRRLEGCRSVHYCGADLVGARSLLLTDVPAQIEWLVCEGLYVDWAEHRALLYLRVWELDGPEPDWPKVFAEESLVDIDEILGQASSGG